MSSYTEDHLVEQPAVQLMQHELGWDVVNCLSEIPIRKPMRLVFSRNRENRKNVKIELPFTENSVFTTT